MKVVIPSTFPGGAPQFEGAEVVVVPPDQAVPEAHLDADVLVVWGQPQTVIDDAARRMIGLRLVQGLAAGADSVLAAGFDDDVVLANGVGLHDDNVAEHILALTLALVRFLPLALVRKSERHWDHHLGGAVSARGDDGRVVSLRGAKVTVWGFGSIGATVAPLLKSLGAEVTGVARSAGERHGFPVVADEGLDEVLADTDVLVMILPSLESTAKALGAERLAALKDGALLVNVGRGTTVDEEALVAALRSGRLAAAALDVTAVEPLPAESPLWDEPNVLITPHIASDRPTGASEFVARQVSALATGGQLRNVLR
ncbi:phosphoglycerate dehydrogenase [Tessaracoccus sp. MC1865]|uniref:NAD(P)-dependent oxidoreductase n=1 Tax=Tessaracoccus sp. MC1865 TaxID=2760310 RepID=UPI0015FFAF5A|nr:NAD(P)-dependent oxidoreductase [Tessaracoccus sp. MC1865]MBB1483854.1 phosphoglycerate dehydrogenase [Tessaracoccus sp. MC1865]QTO36909.1 dihydrofolate reductase [Tessaracoccus sp. MC1865]